ncbi:MAG: hypothetical protein IKC73_06140 [Clostridia bacterium]|nr:hypothetical protein [Clostridia bacterium]
MIITFCGHSDYMGNAEDEERLLALLESVIKGEPVDFYLGGYGILTNLRLVAQKNTKGFTQTQGLCSLSRIYIRFQKKGRIFSRNHTMKFFTPRLKPYRKNLLSSRETNLW